MLNIAFDIDQHLNDRLEDLTWMSDRDDLPDFGMEQADDGTIWLNFNIG